VWREGPRFGAKIQAHILCVAVPPQVGYVEQGTVQKIPWIQCGTSEIQVYNRSTGKQKKEHAKESNSKFFDEFTAQI
jgi:hypothetical protein